MLVFLRCVGHAVAARGVKAPLGLVPWASKSMILPCMPWRATGKKLAHYLTQVPAIAWQTLKRPDDLAGTTVPPHVHLQEPLQLGNFLPRRLARFQAGQPVSQAPQWQLVQLLGKGGASARCGSRSTAFSPINNARTIFAWMRTPASGCCATKAKS